MRMLVPRLSRVAQVSLKARVEMSFRRAFTSSSFQKYSWRPCTHSKYETTTPPAFASTSGKTRIPRSSRISSAAGVVGPFAPSQTIFAFTLSAFSVVITCSREHVAVEQEQLLVCDLLGAEEPSEPPRLLLVRDRGLDVDPVRVVDPARRVRDGDHRGALGGEELRQEAADVPKALDGDA